MAPGYDCCAEWPITSLVVNVCEALSKTNINAHALEDHETKVQSEQSPLFCKNSIVGEVD